MSIHPKVTLLDTELFLYMHFVMSQLLYSLVGTANSINIRLRVSSPHGLLLWTGGREDVPNTPDHLLLGIDRGHLQVLYVISS